MKKVLLFLILISFVGCAHKNLPDYIKAERPISRKVVGNYEKIIEAIKVVLFKNRWNIKSIENSFIYERLPGGVENSNDIVIFTKTRSHQKIIYSTHEHLNIFIHPIADGADVDIRYEIVDSSLAGQYHKYRNQRLINKLFDMIEKELESN